MLSSGMAFPDLTAIVRTAGERRTPDGRSRSSKGEQRLVERRRRVELPTLVTIR